MLSVYRLFAIAAAPLALAWLRWKAPGPPQMRARWRERSGHAPSTAAPAIWVHASSVGEVNAVQPLVKALLERLPDHSLVISTFTATGLDRAEQLFGERVTTSLIALDTPWRVARWLDKLRPTAGIIVETEIWPELFVQCKQRGIPLLLANARLAPKAMKHYRRWRPLFLPALEAVAVVAAQSEADAGRFREIGIDDGRIRVTGNLKFDMPLSEHIGRQAMRFREQWGQRPTWVAGSTREGEEEIVLAAHRQIIETHPDALLVLAPRHPHRCPAVRRVIEDAGMAQQAAGDQVDDDTPVVLVDGMGLLQSCYAAASATFVGGSLVDIGGHNLLEPAALGKAVIAGPHLHQQADSAAALAAADALVSVNNAEELALAVLAIWSGPEIALQRGRAALGVIESGRGSTRRTLKLFEDLVGSTISAADD